MRQLPRSSRQILNTAKKAKTLMEEGDLFKNL